MINKQDLTKQLKELIERNMELKLQHVTQQLSQTHLLKANRKAIARLYSQLNHK